MPEGHTLHRLAGELNATFAGRAVRVTSPQGRFAESAALVDGSVVTGAEAWGKHLFVAFEGGRFVHVHLGLYGTFLVHPVVEEVPAPVGQVRMRLETGAPGAASYADLRGATSPRLLLEIMAADSCSVRWMNLHWPPSSARCRRAWSPE